jgi:aryl-alcohol dehydrogenase-like predicted oxidoreductase
VKHRKLGSTDLEISEIVFGAGAVGGAVFRGERSQRLRCVERALELGITWIDTAPLYGNGQSEENLGWILEELGASPRISTKVLANPAAGDLVASTRASLEASLGRLRRERVELVQLHLPVGHQRTERGVISVEDVLGPGGVADALDAVCEAGLARYRGFSGFGDTKCLLELIDSGRFDTVQAYHNLLNPSAGRALPPGFPGQDFGRLILRAAERGVGVLGIRALAAGAVVGEGRFAAAGLSPGASPEQDAALAPRVRDALPEAAGTLAQAAIRFALSQPGISGVVIGFSGLDHIEDAAEAARRGPLTEAEMRGLEELYAQGLPRAQP